MKKTLALLLTLIMMMLAVGASAESLSVLAPGNTQQFLEGEDANNNDIHSWLEEHSGLELTYTVLPYEGQEEKRNLIMASGEAPDLVVIQNRDVFLDYVSQGLLQPLDEYIAKSEALKGSPSADPAVASMAVVDGQSYAICTPTNGSIAPVSYLYNIKAIEDAGVTVPEELTPETLHDFLLEIKEKCPDKIPFTAAGAATNDYRLHGFDFLYCAYGLDTEFRVAEDGTLEMSSTTEDMRELLTLIAKMSAEGLIDPEYAVTKVEKLQEKFLDDRVATMGLQWYEEAVPTTLMANEDGSFIWQWMGNVGGRENSTMQEYGATAQNYLCVPFNSTKQQAAVDYAALLTSPEAYEYIMIGEEGYDFNFDENGEYVLTPENRRSIVGTQYFVYYYVSENLEQRTERIWRNDAGQDWYQQWEYHCGMELKGEVDPAVDKPVIDEYVEYISDIRALSAEYFMKIATGALPVEAFDEYLEKFDQLGGTEIVEAINEWYASK